MGLDSFLAHFPTHITHTCHTHTHTHTLHKHRSLVSKASIQELNGPPPTPTSKTQFWNIAMYELKRYRENINVMLERMGGKVTNTNSTPKPPRELKLTKPTKEVAQPSPGQVHNHVDYSQQEGTRYSQEPVITLQTLPVSNYVPFSPQLVEVNVNLSETEDGSMHGNSATLMHSLAISEPSTPGSEPELQIDLGEPGGAEQRWRAQQERHSPANIRVTPPAKSSMLGGLNRTPMILNINSSRQSVASPIVSSPQVSGSSPVLWTPNFKRGLRGRKPGEALSALATSLAERKRVAELGSQTPMLTTPTSALGDREGGYGNGNYQEAMEMDTSLEDSDEVKATQLNSQFSSVYLDRAKTAIAVVDPDQKRLRKRKKIAVEQTPKKVPRIQNTSKIVTSIANISDLDMHGETMAASLTSQVNAAVNLGRQDSPSNGRAETLKVKLTQNGQTSPGRAVSASPGGGGAGVGRKLGGLSGKGGNSKAGGKGKGGKFIIGSHAGKKAKGRAKNASLAKSSSVWPAKTTSAATPTTAVSSHSTSPQLNPVFTPLASQDSSLTATTTPMTAREGVAMARYGLVEEETPEFAEGSGLLAETVQKVDRSFRARINQMAGSSEDMGYQYFSEKVRKTCVHVIKLSGSIHRCNQHFSVCVCVCA